MSSGPMWASVPVLSHGFIGFPLTCTVSKMCVFDALDALNELCVT